MIGLVIVTHAALAQGFLAAAQMIVGPQPNACALEVRREESIEELQTRLGQLIAEVGRAGNGVIVLTDMFGGTPTNLGLPFLEAGKVEILAGVNLPMVLKCFSSRNAQPLPDLAAILKDYGRQGVVLISETIADR